MKAPKLRPNARHELRANIYNTLENIFETELIYISCINCANFREKTEMCGLVMQRPPAKVIAYACPKWEDKDEIPF